MQHVAASAACAVHGQCGPLPARGEAASLSPRGSACSPLAKLNRDWMHPRKANEQGRERPAPATTCLP
eukprot:CAMPEP_0119357568 /NCGR_PEP_ID=MMETSP1334-20130426/5935_1 /TAXON_ID=127549 /ORGANISM="Calcidiscus leptoporus, Strain RCC1130" /LENGTH=67 /DNA_ID=CAMNT_0007371847 /DNA_START=73 /DNA_END=273 /DNA_ORIENTATION=-